MKIRKFLLLGGVILSSAVNAQTITLEQVFQHVIDKHPAFVVENYQPEITRKRQDQVYGRQDWSLSTYADYRHTTYEQHGEDYFYSNRKYIDKNFNMGINKAFWGLGANMRLNYGTGRGDREYGYSDGESENSKYYSSSIRANFNIDLLRNIGGIQYRRFYELLGYDISISEIRQDENKEAFLLRVGQDYLSWLTTSELQKLTAHYIETAGNLLEYVKSAEGSVSNSRKVLHASRYSLSANRQNAAYTASFKEQQKRLSEYLQRAELLEESPVYKTDTKSKLPEKISAEQISATRLMQTFAFRENQLDHNRRATLNNTNPNLDFSIGGGLGGRGEHFKDSHDSDTHDYNIRLDFSTFIENTSARAELDSVDLRRIELKNLKHDAELSLSSDLRSVLQLLNELQKVLDYAKQSVELATQTVQQDLDSFKTGAIDITVLIRSMENELYEKTAYTEAETRYRQAYLSYLALSDQLWQGNNSGSVLLPSDAVE